MKLLGCAMCLFIGMTLSSSAFYFYLIISQYMVSPTYQLHKQIVQKMVDQAKNLIAPANQVDSNQVSIDIFLLEKERNMVNSNNNASYDHDLKKRIELFLVQLRSKLRSWELRSTSILWRKENQYNHYNVTYRRSPPTYPSVDRLCTLAFRTIEPSHQPFASNGFAKVLPKVPLMTRLRSRFPRRDTCAIVTNSGSLIGAKKGREIDSHDVIIRFNDAPTLGYEEDVGSRTSIRLLNSQVVSRSSFNISDSLYGSTFNLVWDPSQYNVDLGKWFSSPDHNFFPLYQEARLTSPEIPFYIVHPQVVWDLWIQLQTSKGHRIMRTPPSSGFIGLFLAIRLCSYVYAYEYIPSIRLTERCHYYDNSTSLGCSFGDWHPLATEKLYALHLNTASDYDLAINGRLRTRGCG